MNDSGKAQVRAVAAGLFGFVLVVGAGAYFLVPRAAAPASVSAATASVFAAPPSRRSELPVPEPTRAPSAVAGSSPAPLLSDEFRAGPAAAQPMQDSARSAAGVAAPDARSGSAEAARAEAAVHLIATGPADVSGGAGSSYAAPSGAAAAVGGAAKSAAPAAKARARTVAAADVAVVHYGSSDRSQLMERAAGPVYNFGALGARGDPIAGAMQQVDAARQQVQASPDVSAADKAALDQGVDQVHAVAYQAGAAAAQATVSAGAATAPSGSR